MARLFDDASGQFAQVEAAVATAFPISMSCWFLTDTVVTEQALMWLGDKNVIDHWHADMMITSGGKLQIDSRQISFAQTITDGSVAADVWQHAGGVWPDASNRHAYLNGTEKTGTGTKNPNTPNRTCIGRRGDSTPSIEFSGRIAEAAVWDIALTAGEMRALANRVSPLRIRPANIIAYWPLYGVSSPEPNLTRSGSSLNMALTNGPTQAAHAPTQPSFGISTPTLFVPSAAPPVPPATHPIAYCDF